MTTEQRNTVAAADAETAVRQAGQRREERRARACALRASGASLDEVAADLGVSRSTAFHWTRHVREQNETAARRARRAREAEAQELRRRGTPYKEIARRLGVSPSTAYSWTNRVEPEVRQEQVGRRAEQVREMRRRRWEPVLRRREQERQQGKLDAANSVGDLPASLLPVLGALAYWCEGAKSKPWQRMELLQFINSDPLLIRLFLAWLRAEGVTDDRLRFRVSIHETADLAAAEESWAAEVGVPRERFERATLKRHNPRTNRKNVSQDYRGCLMITVTGSRELYWRVEGLFVGTAHALEVLHPRSARA